ncbi:MULTISPECIES: hypothetical protein [Bacteroidales]|uniref:hypothetical protein n=1 Tax=Bacteroidales TaxID=171549 RepID=UPI0004B65BAB|nr:MULTISPECIES: hypothetical protein [Bacteroidales]MCE9386994.1 hypothetical protein [Bacteroides fragilis]MCM1138034.1 hypothetical protein [Muribaculum sp.]MCM1447068.1 hypothetical protein [Bacteroides sp.]MCX4295261.1 hypothetical protein [Prevotella sp.]MCE9206022.1 hypothetical protein [Bacteroides thetaiotaomicron]
MPTSTTLCHLLPDLIETIAGCRIMYFFAGEGMIAAKGKSASRTMTAVSAQHASTFGEPIVR